MNNLNFKWGYGFFACVLVLCMVSGCGAKRAVNQVPEKRTVDTSLLHSPETATMDREAGSDSAEPSVTDSIQETPRFKNLDPLDSEMVDISVVDESYAQVLQAMAHAAGLNLSIAPEAAGLLGGRLTAEYQQMSVREILDSVCSVLNVAWHEQAGVLVIEPYVRKYIDLDFLGSIRESSFQVGGDVLGEGGSGAAGGGSSPLRGHFEVSGHTTATVTDVYANIESSVEHILGGDGRFVLNRQTGNLMVLARPAAARDVEEFVAVLREKYQRQVLIEAKIIEVGLSKKHELGIDWRQVGAFLSYNAINSLGTNINIAPTVGPDSSFYSMTINSKYSDINGIFHALEEYGDLTILSNPRLKAMNGQSSLISVGQSVSYLRSFEQNSEGTGDNRTVEYTTEIGSVFDGVLLGVTPVIESGGAITLHIVPIKSDLVELDEVNFGPTFSSYQITLPRVNLREISTVARVRSGDIVLLGGLIMDYDDVDNNGIPYLMDLPLLGALFRYESREKKHVELVVALQIKTIDT